MEKFLKRKSVPGQGQVQEKGESSTSRNCNQQGNIESSLKQQRIDINLSELPSDPGKRKRISSYHPSDRDMIRREYLQKGPCQPRNHTFPQTKIGKVSRKFCTSWFNEFGNWLEYSIEKDVAFCLCCYLFKPDYGMQGGGDAFVNEGFRNWNKKERLTIHVGGPNSMHNQAWKKCQDLMNQNQHIQTALFKQSEQSHNIYRTRLSASIDYVRFLLKQGLPFRAHNETESSSSRGNFLEILKFLADHNETIKNVVLQNAPENNQLTAPDIQKDIVNAAAVETTNAIINDLGDELFAILVDESRDASHKEQMDVVLRYVDKKGSVIERFLGIIHVSDTTASSLKAAIESLLCKHSLSISRVRGQGYDGASNMRGEFNGLKSLILRENPSAFYVHCFAHQLQLTLVAVAKNHIQVASLFNLIASLLNVVGGSCKRHNLLREKQIARVKEALESGKIISGRGLNQETSLKRPCDTRWSSHYGTLLNLIHMFSSVIDVPEQILEDGAKSWQRAEASGLLDSVHSYDFIFTMHLMKNILGITNELSLALQRKDQDIMIAMKLVNVSKERLQRMRDDGWEELLHEVSIFCNSYDIEIPNMSELFAGKGRSQRKIQKITNLHHYRVELFYTIIDMQLKELNDRFNEVNTELLLCVACLNPDNCFAAFDKQKLIRLAQFYPIEFSSIELTALDNQLETYIVDIRTSSDFLNLRGIVDLAKKLVETRRNLAYPLVYLIVKLALLLPVGTATVERAFSAMKFVKTRLCNKMGDSWLNDSLVTFIEKDVFDTIDNELIIQRFQNMKTHRGQL